VAKSAQLADENLVLAKKLRSAEQQAEQSTGYAQEVRKGLTQALEQAVEAARAAQQQVGRSHRRRAAAHRERERECYAVSHESSVTHEFSHAVPGGG